MLTVFVPVVAMSMAVRDIGDRTALEEDGRVAERIRQQGWWLLMPEPVRNRAQCRSVLGVPEGDGLAVDVQTSNRHRPDCRGWRAGLSHEPPWSVV